MTFMKKWKTIASNILKAELKRRGITYNQLQMNLEHIGITDTVDGLKTKISRGSFQFAFFLQCASAIGIKILRLDELINSGVDHNQH